MSARRQLEVYRLGAQGSQEALQTPEPALIDDAIAYYEGASLLFQRGLNHYR